MKILVLNQYSPNKGDRAVLYALLRELKAFSPKSVVVSTYDTSLWKNCLPEFGYQLRFVPWGWNELLSQERSLVRRIVARKYPRFFERRVFPSAQKALANGGSSYLARTFCHPEFRRALKDCDVVISTGGHHVTTLLTQEAITPQLFDLGLAVVSGKSVFLWSQTVGPLKFENQINADYVRSVLQRCKGIYVRDTESHQILSEYGVSDSSVRQTHESVLTLADSLGEYVYPSSRSGGVGVSIYCKRRTDQEHESYVDALAKLTKYIVQKGFQVSYFPMEMQGTRGDDRPTINEILARAECEDAVHVLEQDLPTADHLARIADCKVFVGHKTHSIVFSLTAGTPCLALAYHPKSRDFMQQFGVEDFCIDDKDLTAERAERVFDALVGNIDSVGQKLRDHALTLCQSIRSDFANMLKSVA